MKYVYKAALKLSYLISDLAEFIAQPLVDCIWDIGGSIECWAHTKLTKLGANTPLDIEAPTGWVGHDRYNAAIAEIEAAMRGEVPENFKGMSSKQVYALLEQEQR
jgi:hypothetical protein